MPKIDITLSKREFADGGWKAALADNPGVWEYGKTDVEALGKLMISAAGHLSVSILRENDAKPRTSSRRR